MYEVKITTKKEIIRKQIKTLEELRKLILLYEKEYFELDLKKIERVRK